MEEIEIEFTPEELKRIDEGVRLWYRKNRCSKYRTYMNPGDTERTIRGKRSMYLGFLIEEYIIPRYIETLEDF